jgi:hypothetical protein
MSVVDVMDTTCPSSSTDIVSQPSLILLKYASTTSCQVPGVLRKSRPSWKIYIFSAPDTALA